MRRIGRFKRLFLAKTSGEWSVLLEGMDTCFGSVSTLDEVEVDTLLASGAVLQAEPPEE